MKTIPRVASFFVLTAVAILSFAAPTVVAQQRPPTNASRSPVDSVTAKVDQLFARWNKSDSPGCSLGVSHNGAVVYERGYGIANLDYGLPITPASIFHVASITKQFTAMAIMILAQRGQLSLDDRVQRYIAELPDYGAQITLRHLLTHTSGLREGFRLRGLAEPRDRDTDVLVMRLARQKALNFLPGSEFEYLNDGYALLGLIVERVSRQSLAAFLDSSIFKPLGMAHTHLNEDPSMIVPNRAVGYDRDAGNWTIAVDQWRWNYTLEAGRIGAGGPTGLYTTVRDLLTWEQNFAEVRVGDPALVTAMQTPNVLTNGYASDYGFGLFVRPYRGLRTVGHAGGDPGYSAYVERYPDQGLAVAVLCNAGDGLPTTGLSRSVADIYLADVFPPSAASSAATAPPGVSLSAEQLASKVGLYRNPLNHVDWRGVLLRDGKLRAYGVNSSGGALDIANARELTPVSANRFVLPGSEVLWDFLPSARGPAQEIRQSGEGPKPVVWQRVEAFVPSRVDLRAFAGAYVSPELESTCMMAARDSDLVIQIRGRTDVVLRPLFADVFQGEEGNRIGMVRFLRDSRGGVTGFTVNKPGVRGLRFERVRR